LSESANRRRYYENGKQAESDNWGCSGTHIVPHNKEFEIEQKSLAMLRGKWRQNI
jgi:hypothetical protein